MWRDVIARLGQRGVGVEMPCHDDHCRYARWNHALWADNIFLAAKSALEAQVAATAFTTALRDWGMEWKEESLDMMVCGTQYTDTVTVQIGSRI
eukprot:5098678-Pyramimonas_sp.AAC.1